MERLDTQDAYQYLESRSKSFPDLDSVLYSYKLTGSSYGLDVPILKDLDVDESTYSLFIPIADGNVRDGVGDLLEVTGINTTRHRLNSIVLFDHGKNVQLPIARAREDPKDIESYSFKIDPGSKTAGLRAYFYTGKEDCDPKLGCKQYDHAEFCSQIWDMMTKGFINSGSIGYQIQEADSLAPDYNQGIPQGMHLKRILMLEGSGVILPAHPLTTVKSLPHSTKSLYAPESYPAYDKIQSLLTGGRICGKNPSPYLIKALEPYRRPSKSTVISGWKSLPHPVDCKCSKCMKKLTKSCSCSSCCKGHACPCGTKHIEKNGDGYDLVSKKTGKVLGHHPTREAAVKQEQAIEASKHSKSLKGLRDKYRRQKPTPEQIDRREALKKVADTVGKVVTGGAALGSGAAAARDHLKATKEKSLTASLRKKYLKKAQQPSQRPSAKIVGPGSGTSPGTPAQQLPPVQSQRRSATVDFNSASGTHQAPPGTQLPPTQEESKGLSSYEQKALDTNRLHHLRKKYAKNGNRMRVLRHGKPTHVVIHTSSKNLDKLRKEAGSQGVEVKWLADDGKGITKIKLSGSKTVLDKFANAYGKQIKRKKRS